MNFLPCRLVERSGALAVEIGDDLSLPVPARRTAIYRSHAGRDLLLGLRPEHITERRSYVEGAEFTRTVDVLEPMGTETMVHLEIAGADVCARCSPDISAAPGTPMSFMAQMDHMHLIDPATEEVITAQQNKAVAA
jgi:multiple sugar transport system ATP-binding protein